MSRLLDLEHLSPAALDGLGLEELQRIIASYERLVSARDADPQLRRTVEHRIRESVALGRVSEERGAELLATLEKVHPGVVLAGSLGEIADLDRPTIGFYRKAFPRREVAGDPDGVGWLAADPRRLAGVVREMARFSTDWVAIAGATAELADGAGIDEETADGLIAAAIRNVRQEGRRGRAS